MKHKRKQIKLIIVTAVLFVVALTVTIVFVEEINQQSTLLREQVLMQQKDQAQLTQLTQLKKLTAETNTDREVLASYYLASQSDSIDFLNYIEDLATEKSIDLKTKNASEITDGGTQKLEVSYQLAGSRLQIDQFLKLLEVIPYVSKVTSVGLTKRTAFSWDANVTVEVTILNEYGTDS